MPVFKSAEKGINYWAYNEKENVKITEYENVVFNVSSAEENSSRDGSWPDDTNLHLLYIIEWHSATNVYSIYSKTEL